MSQVIIGGTIVLWAAPRWRRALYRIGLKRHHRWLGDVGRSARITATGNDILKLARKWSEYRKEYGTTFRDVTELAAALRGRDNTIARVRAVLDDFDGLAAEPIPKLSTHAWMHEVRAALDPQETP